MNFRKKVKQDDLEINFIPLIDVLLVIIIFLVVSTTFSKFSELKINLPTAEANQVDKKVEKINISISANGDYAINEVPLSSSTINSIVINLQKEANKIKDPVIIISADSDSPHQSVINVMEAARIAGLSKITFSTKAK
jgi:biopolymer transport protein ExbD